MFVNHQNNPKQYEDINFKGIVMSMTQQNTCLNKHPKSFILNSVFDKVFKDQLKVNYITSDLGK